MSSKRFVKLLSIALCLLICGAASVPGFGASAAVWSPKDCDLQKNSEPTPCPPEVCPTATPKPVVTPKPTAAPTATPCPPEVCPTVKPASKPTATPCPAQTCPTAKPNTGSGNSGCPVAQNTPKPGSTAKPVETQIPTTTTTPKPSTGGDYTTGSVSAQEAIAFQLLNEDRVNNGKAALVLDAALSSLARMKSCDMNTNHYFAHTSPTLGSAANMLRNSGYSFTSVGENIAHHATVTKAEAAFMSSSGHRTNILGSQWTKVGIGVCFDSQGFVYVTQLFVR